MTYQTVALIGILISVVGSAVAAWLGYRSAANQRRQLEENLRKLIGERALIEQFQAANNTIASIQNSVENRKITDSDVSEIVAQIQSVERTYENVLRQLMRKRGHDVVDPTSSPHTGVTHNP